MEIGQAGNSEREKKSMQNVTQRNGAGDNCADAAAAAASAAVDAKGSTNNNNK